MKCEKNYVKNLEALVALSIAGTKVSKFSLRPKSETSLICKTLSYDAIHDVFVLFTSDEAKAEEIWFGTLVAAEYKVTHCQLEPETCNMYTVAFGRLQ